MLHNCNVCFITLSVPDLAEAETFYVDVLGFKVSRRFAPGKWLSLSVDETKSCGFGLIECKDGKARPEGDMVDFWVDDLNAIFNRIASRVKVERPPETTPWGSFKAVIKDPFGHRIGLVEIGA